MFDTPDRGRGRKGGVLPVALVASAELDLMEIDLGSLRLEGAAPLRHGFEDVSAPPAAGESCLCGGGWLDGHEDLVLHFPKASIASAMGAASGETGLTLTGRLLDGTPIELHGCVTVP